MNFFIFFFNFEKASWSLLEVHNMELKVCCKELWCYDYLTVQHNLESFIFLLQELGTYIEYIIIIQKMWVENQ